MTRGQTSGDDTAFTDTVYRTNQAFEGSLKEAYRVFTDKDPAKKTIADIEVYLQQEHLLRDRVVAQFTSYRREWRNPSTHDYRLDFDEDESLLAIVSVAAFAIVLVDQIVQYLSFQAARAVPQEPPAPATPARPAEERVVDALLAFRWEGPASGDAPAPREPELLGALAGHLTTALPDAEVQPDMRVSETGDRVDLVVLISDAKVPIEVKRSPRPPNLSLYLAPLLRDMSLLRTGVGVLYVFPTDQPDLPMERRPIAIHGTDDKILVVQARRQK